MESRCEALEADLGRGRKTTNETISASPRALLARHPWLNDPLLAWGVAILLATLLVVVSAVLAVACFRRNRALRVVFLIARANERLREELDALKWAKRDRPPPTLPPRPALAYVSVGQEYAEPPHKGSSVEPAVEYEYSEPHHEYSKSHKYSSVARAVSLLRERPDSVSTSWSNLRAPPNSPSTSPSSSRSDLRRSEPDYAEPVFASRA